MTRIAGASHGWEGGISHVIRINLIIVGWLSKEVT